MWRLGALPACLLAFTPASAWTQAPPLLPPFRVDRVLVDARILDARGREVRDLHPEDLSVTIDGKPARVESIDWTSEGAPRRAATPARLSAGEAPPIGDEPPGRLIVFLFQKDFFEPGRINGLLRMKEYAIEFAQRLTPRDLSAVLTFDSRLRLHLDFTNDKARLEEALRHALLRDEPDGMAPGVGPSLAALIPKDRARRAATAEMGLTVLAEALERLPGAKSLVFFCWGLGRLQAGTFDMESDYAPARAALARSRTAVFALDVSTADSHSLEVGLQAVAADTGGFYARTYDAPRLAMARLRGALSGHYVLAIERPAGPRGAHRVGVALVSRKGTVLARSSYVD